jgi:hypothetical protein
MSERHWRHAPTSHTARLGTVDRAQRVHLRVPAARSASPTSRAPRYPRLCPRSRRVRGLSGGGCCCETLIVTVVDVEAHVSDQHFRFHLRRRRHTRYIPPTSARSPAPMPASMGCWPHHGEQPCTLLGVACCRGPRDRNGHDRRDRTVQLCIFGDARLLDAIASLSPVTGLSTGRVYRVCVGRGHIWGRNQRRLSRLRVANGQCRQR